MHPLQIQRYYVGHIFYMMKWLWKWMANYPPWIDSTTHSKSDGCHFYYIYYCGRNQCVHWGCCQSQSWSAGDILKRSRSYWTFQKRGLHCWVGGLHIPILGGCIAGEEVGRSISGPLQLQLCVHKGDMKYRGTQAATRQRCQPLKNMGGYNHLTGSTCLKRSRSLWTFQKKGLCCIVDELSYVGWSECIDTLTIRPMVLSTTDTTTTLSIKQSFQTPDWSTETRLLLFQNAGNWSWATYIAMPISSTHNMPGSWW